MRVRPTAVPGRSILQGMAHILGDSKPLDPEKGWDKSWAYLKELGKYVEYYPTGTAITLKEFAQGQRWIIAGIMEWDMKPRAQSVIPPESKITILENTTFVVDGHYWCIPVGVPQDQVDVILDLMKFMRKPEQQVLTWTAFIGPVDQGGDDRQGAEGHPGTGQGILASRIRPDRHQVEDLAAARRQRS